MEMFLLKYKFVPIASNSVCGGSFPVCWKASKNWRSIKYLINVVALSSVKYVLYCIDANNL